MMYTPHISSTIPTDYSSIIAISTDPYQNYFQKLEADDSFRHPIFNNISTIKIINHFSRDYLFVLSRNYTVLQIDFETMKIINFYDPTSCHPYRCETDIFINLISSIKYSQNSFMFYCYIKSSEVSSSHLLSHCYLNLKNKDSQSNNIKWFKRGFTSTDPSHNTLFQQAQHHLFIATHINQQPIIYRTRPPNSVGYIDESDYLVNAPALHYLEKNTEFLTSFQIDHSVYFVIVEYITHESVSIGQCKRNSDNSDAEQNFQNPVAVTRIIKICNHDPGGFGDQNQQNFGTLAKSDIFCTVDETNEEEKKKSSPFIFTKALSASWSNHKLFILFENQKNGPDGSVVCIYNYSTIMNSFNGPIRNLWTELNCLNNKENRNPLPNICQILYHNNLTTQQQIVASSMSVTSLYRATNLLPIGLHPIIRWNQKYFNNIRTTNITQDVQLVLLYNTEKLIVYNYVTNHSSLCFVASYSTKFAIRDLDIKIDLKPFKSTISVFVSEIDQLSRLNLNICHKFHYLENCVNQAPLMCGWNGTQCVLITNIDTDSSRKVTEIRSRCMNNNLNGLDQIFYKCVIQQNGLELECDCFRWPKVEIKNCRGKMKIVNNQSQWQPWGQCKLNEVKYQSRKCSGAKSSCVGRNEDFQMCYPNQTKLYKTTWTNWLPQVHSLAIYKKFRAICYLDSSIKSDVEENEAPCASKCQEADKNNITWTAWSSCISLLSRYRLFGCLTKYNCPLSHIQIQPCKQNNKELKFGKSVGTNQIHTTAYPYTLVQMVMAVVSVSLFWLIVIVIILFVKYPKICLWQLKVTSNTTMTTNNATITKSLITSHTDETSVNTTNEISPIRQNQQVPSPPPIPPHLGSTLLISPSIIETQQYRFVSLPSTPDIHTIPSFVKPPTPPPHANKSSFNNTSL